MTEKVGVSHPKVVAIAIHSVDSTPSLLSYVCKRSKKVNVILCLQTTLKFNVILRPPKDLAVLAQSKKI
jgi:hypothetical protein